MLGQGCWRHPATMRPALPAALVLHPATMRPFVDCGFWQPKTISCWCWHPTTARPDVPTNSCCRSSGRCRSSKCSPPTNCRASSDPRAPASPHVGPPAVPSSPHLPPASPEESHRRNTNDQRYKHHNSSHQTDGEATGYLNTTDIYNHPLHLSYIITQRIPMNHHIPNTIAYSCSGINE